MTIAKAISYLLSKGLILVTPCGHLSLRGGLKLEGQHTPSPPLPAYNPPLTIPLYININNIINTGRELIDSREIRDYLEGGVGGELSAEDKPFQLASEGKQDGRKTRSPLTGAPKEFRLDAKQVAWALSLGFTKDGVQTHTERFLDWHRAKGKRRRDWHASWRNWMRRAADYSIRQAL